jgi:hypothetical protein
VRLDLYFVWWIKDYTCYPSYSGSRDQEGCDSKSVQANILEKPITKKGLVQLFKCRPWVQNSVLQKKKKKKRKKERELRRCRWGRNIHNHNFWQWKCHNKTPCIAILNKQKYHLFYKNDEQEGKTGPVWRAGTSGSREDIRKECWRMNIVGILCTHVYKWKRYTRNGEREDKGK